MLQDLNIIYDNYPVEEISFQTNDDGGLPNHPGLLSSGCSNEW
jgi:hypothetical protein